MNNKILFAVITCAIVTTAIVRANDVVSESQHLKYSAELTIESHGKRLPAIYYGAAGIGPHPTIILLHGYPGNEKNLDIAQGMRDAGWNVLFFHYRGAWGAEGEFSFLNSEQDVNSVIQYLSAPENSNLLKINSKSLSLVGHSMGGHMAISGILDNPDVKCAVAYDAANIGVGFIPVNQEMASLDKAYGDSLFMLKGWSGNKSLDEAKNNQERLNLINRASKIKGRSVLMVNADSEIIPIAQIQAVTKALKDAGGHTESILLKDDHSFNNNRKQLLTITNKFLMDHCR